MTRVLMLETAMGSENGYDVKAYMRGRTYEISDFLAESFAMSGVIRLLDDIPDDGFLEPLDFGGSHNEIEKTAKRGRGRPRKNA